MTRHSRRARLARVALLTLVVGAVVGGLILWQVGVHGPGLERLTFLWGGREYALLDPLLLGLAVALPLLWLAPLFSLSDLPRWQRALTVVLRSGALALIVLALARPAVSDFRQQVSTVFLADVSDSIPAEALQRAQGFLDEAWRTAGGADVHLVTFAGEPREVVEPASAGDDELDAAVAPTSAAQGPTSAPRLARLAGSGRSTDIEAALKMAYGLFPPDQLKRVVLLTDGHQTDGDLLSEALNAARFGVKVHYKTFEVQPPPELLVADLQLPREIEVGSPLTVRAQLFTTAPTAATLDLWQDDFREGESRTVQLTAGNNTVELPATVREPGFKRFRLEVTTPAGADREADNNTFTQVAVVKGPPRVLLLEGEPQHARHLERALRAQQIDVEVRSPQGMPSRLEELESFDLLVLSDLHASYLANHQMELIGTYLRDLGGGLLMTGGENSFGPGGYFHTPLEEVLPVRLDIEKKRETPTMDLALLIDKSGSMADEKIELAKEAARAVVELLDADDRLAVVAFSGAAEVIVRLQPARNRLRIFELIAKLRGGGGTEILPGLQAIADQLASSDAQIRHVILLTDGEFSDGRPRRDEILERIGELAAEGVTVSTVGVGGEPDRSLLSAIAETGRGREYNVESMQAVPRIFTGETQTVSHKALIEEPFHPVVERPSQIFRGVPLEQAPYLLGYVSTKAKKGAELLLTTEQGEPLLARMKVGLGTSVAWTSDIKGRWSPDWISWPFFGRFWAQLVRDTMRVRRDLGFELRAEARGGRARILLDALDRSDRFVNGMQTRVKISGPQQSEQEIQLEQTAAGRYEGTASLPHFGSYLLEALHVRDGKQVGTTLGGLANPYPRELLQHGIDRELLHQVARLTGGQEEVTPAGVFDPQGEQVRYHREFELGLILAALVLFLLDVLLRRVRLGRAGEVVFPG